MLATTWAIPGIDIAQVITTFLRAVRAIIKSLFSAPPDVSSKTRSTRMHLGTQIQMMKISEGRLQGDGVSKYGNHWIAAGPTAKVG